jgi:hypothetical protein
MANNPSMKIIEYTMPLMFVFMAYTWYSALGMYWIFQTAFAIVQMLILSRLIPVPVFTEEDYKRAEDELAGKTPKKKKKKKPAVEAEDEDGDETAEPDVQSDDDDAGTEALGAEDIPRGINPAVKKQYQKTGKRYNIKKRKK